jgi:probable rRNA maturation factor
MEIALDNRSSVLLDLKYYRQLAAFVLAAERVDVPCELSLSFVDEPEIQALNRRYRGIDAVTDVLSFALEEEAPTGGSDVETSTEAVMGTTHCGSIVRTDAEAGVVAISDGSDVETSAPFILPHLLGDVVIAPFVARRHAVDFDSSEAAEMNLLLVHGILHLLGYDHQDDEEAARMEARENELLSLWCDLREGRLEERS